MPYVSDKQRRFFHSPGAAKAGIKPATVQEFDQSSKGMKLPEKVKMAEGGEVEHGFHLLEETPDYFMIEHPSGASAPLPKAGLEEHQQDEIRNFPKSMNYTPDTPPESNADEFFNTFKPENTAEAAPIKNPDNVPEQHTTTDMPSIPTIPQSQTNIFNPGITPEQQKIWQQELGAIQSGSKAQITGQNKISNLAESNIQAMQQATTEFANKRAALDKEQQQLQQDVANQKIDPNHFWNQQTGFKGGANKVMAMMGLFLGGMQASKGGGNPAQMMLDKAINDDIDAQKNNLNKKNSLLKFNLEKYGTLNQAEAATRLDMMNMFNAQLQQIGAQTQSQSIKANADMQSAQLKNNILQQTHALALQSTLHSIMQQGVPDALIGYLPKDQSELLVRVGPNKSVPARSPKDAQDLRESEPVITHAVNMLDDMINSLRGYKEIQTPQGIQKIPIAKTEGQIFPDVLGMGNLTGAGRAGKNAQINLEAALKDVGKTAMRLNEYSDENFLKSRIPNPAQWHTQEALEHLMNTKKELLDRASTARNAKLQSYDTGSVIQAFTPGLAKR